MSSFRKGAGDQARPLRLAVLHTVRHGHSFVEDLVAEVVGAVKQNAPLLEIATHDVARLKLYTCGGCKPDRSAAPCEVNDIDAPAYKADDQFLPIMETLRQADIVLWAVTVRAGGLNTDAQNLLERLDCAHNRVGPETFHGKVVGVVMASPEGDVWTNTTRLTGILNKYGFTVPPYSSLVVTSAGHPAESDEETSGEEGETEDVTSAAQEEILGGRDLQEQITKTATSLVTCAKALQGR